LIVNTDKAKTVLNVDASYSSRIAAILKITGYRDGTAIVLTKQ